MLSFSSLSTGRSLARFVAILAIIAAGACTTAMNWRFSYQLGTSAWDSSIWVIFSVALDVAKWLMLPFAAIAWRAHRARALAALAIWLIATLYSFTAALGFAALNRDTITAERSQQTELHQALAIMRQSPRWQASAACADTTAKTSKGFCAAYRATEARITAVVGDGNPQTALIARLTGTSLDKVNLVLAIFLAVACEVVSALGLFAILPPADNKPVPPKTVAPWKPPKWQDAKLAKAGHVAPGHTTARRSTP